ncbi:T9SS type A sorting domain-containing protein [Hymenobacter coccineus]|uniref:Secretion system C-terminal sorting domain-containing protein n=1 Tax=Hymenobacter coccineus TaxID=1908235 RepID=A0A1G1TFN3_9BACT|nr:T9SS type A sorting domain-containing protein [Hymenobacter coccineus]OGX89686.1 hypothetical protein BEN49_08775 [Hymenobacter coccineus]
MTTTDAGGNATTQSVAVTVVAEVEAVYNVAPVRTADQGYANGQSLATASDGNGAIQTAVLAAASNPMPAGVALNPTMGQVYVADRLLLKSGTYTSTITTTDVTGGTTTQPVTFTIPSNPLPVQLMAFSAVAQGGSAVLNWSTASEINNDHFAVERSVDAKAFEQIGTVPGHGSTSAPHSYQFTEPRVALLGQLLLYYRIRQVDADGVAVLSPVRVVAFSANKSAAAIWLYPNPVSATATLDLSALPESAYSVTVSDLMGRTLLRMHLTGGQPHLLNVQALPAGAYQVTVSGDSVLTTKRLLKQD